MAGSKPLVIMDQHSRRLEELFRPAAFAELQSRCEVVGGVNWPMQRQAFLARLPEAEFVVAARPVLDRGNLDMATRLRAVIEVSGSFEEGLDYDACFERGVEVLSCAPGFQYSVAEMTLGLLLAGGRGIVREHERFRQGSERWFHDDVGHSFSLYGQTIGFVGYGAIARECARLLAPFEPKIKAFDPWLKASGHGTGHAALCALEEVMTTCRCIVVAASPTDENFGLVSRELIDKIPDGTMVVVISRAHLVDFEALFEAADAGRIVLASDVFPKEPPSRHDRIRRGENVIWSPHRAAAVEGGRQPIGDMIVHDIAAMLEGRSERRLQPASPATIGKIVRAPQAAG